MNFIFIPPTWKKLSILVWPWFWPVLEFVMLACCRTLDRVSKHKLLILFLNQIIYCGYSKKKSLN